MSNDSIREVAVAGDGIAAWSAAAALKRRIPSLNVTVVLAGSFDDSIIDRVISTLPSIGVFHEDLGLSDADTIWRARSGLRAGTLFKGWAKGLPDYVHAYGNYGELLGGIAFHQLWLRTSKAERAEPFDRYSTAAELGRAGRMLAAGGEASAAVPEVGYGLRITPPRYHELMRAFALHLGVVGRPGGIADVRLRDSDGFVEELALDDGGTVRADLFVDCTSAAVIRSRLNTEFADWAKWLPCDRLIFGAGEAENESDLLDRATAMPSGWSWTASSPAMSSRGIVYSSAHGTPDEFAERVGAGDTELRIRPGRWARPWVRNCVAIGEAAVSVEPLEWTNLHLAHSQIDRLVSMMPGRDCAAVETAEYNRQCGDEADRVRDFLCMHYLTARRDEPFWKDAAAIEPPDSLAHTLTLFAERGRLPFHEEETFTRDSWLAVLLGQGYTPRRTDPLADIFARDEAQQLVLDYGKSLRSFVDAQPSYREYMTNLTERASL